MQSPYVIHWAPEAEQLFNNVLDALPANAVPVVRQAGAAATVFTTRGRNASEVIVDDVVRGLLTGAPEQHVRSVREALEKNGMSP